MINMSQEANIIALKLQGQGIREITRLTGFSRNTVRKYIREYENNLALLSKETDHSKLIEIQNEITKTRQGKQRNYKRRMLTLEIQKRIKNYLELDNKRDLELGPNKQKLTSRKIYTELIHEGYLISESSVSKFVREEKNKTKEVYIKRDFEYGQRLEYDFHQVKLLINGERITKHQVTIACPKSGFIWIRLYPNENTQTVINSLVEFIEYSKGIFKEFVFDNMSTVVKRSSYGKEKEYTEAIIRLSKYYGFQIVTCNVRSGWEKGSTENGGKFIRKSLFSLNYKFNNETDLRDYILENVELYNVDKQSEFEKEKAALLKMPPVAYKMCNYYKRKANSYSCIFFEKNYYSVPEEYVGKLVDISAYSDVIMIFDKNRNIATHEKIDAINEYSIDFNHFKNTLNRKPGALRDSKALKSNKELHNIFVKYYNMDAKRFLEDYFNNNLQTTEEKYINSNELLPSSELDLITRNSKSQLDLYSTIYK